MSLKELGKTYAASILPALLIFFILQTVPVFGILKILIGGTLYIIVYLTLLIILQVITRSDLEKIGKVASRMMVLKYIMQPILKYMSFISRN